MVIIIRISLTHFNRVNINLFLGIRNGNESNLLNYYVLHVTIEKELIVH